MTDDSLTTEQRDLLQRWFDGELSRERVPEAEALIEDSQAAADYVASLESMRQITRGLADKARGEATWSIDETVQAAVDAPPALDDPLEELAPVLERYHDGEVVEAEAALVRRLRRRRDDVAGYLDVLDKLGDAARAAFEHAETGADIDLWDAVAAELDDEPDEIEGGATASDDAAEAESADVYWLDDYRQGIAGAVAAALVLITVGALFGDRIFPWGERVVEKKTVVIVDSVEHSKGSSVMVDSPMQQTGASDSDTARDESKKGDTQNSDDKPTVIWLLDSKNDDGASGSDDSADQETAPDAGSSDAEQGPSGQPI